MYFSTSPSCQDEPFQYDYFVNAVLIVLINDFCLHSALYHFRDGPDLFWAG